MKHVQGVWDVSLVITLLLLFTSVWYFTTNQEQREQKDRVRVHCQELWRETPVPRPTKRSIMARTTHPQRVALSHTIHPYADTDCL